MHALFAMQNASFSSLHRASSEIAKQAAAGELLPNGQLQVRGSTIPRVHPCCCCIQPRWGRGRWAPLRQEMLQEVYLQMSND